jgi:hypothetical protein
LVEYSFADLRLALVADPLAFEFGVALLVDSLARLIV